MERPILRFALILAVCVTAVILMTDRLPLGVPGEWTWARADVTPGLFAGAFLAVIAGAAYVGFCLLGARRIDRAGAGERAAWLAALVLVAFGWLWAVLDSSPAPLGYARVPWVLYYPRSSGYFWQARYEVDDTGRFLAEYEALLAERDYLHIGTHPPGLTLGYRGLLQLCRSSPALTDAILATQSSGVREAIDIIRRQPVAGTGPIEPADAACLWLAALVTQLFAVLTMVAIYGLAVRHYDCRIAWLTACLWPLVPALAVFYPKSDVFYAFPAVAAAWLWMSACDRQSIVRAISAGVVLWSGMLLSLAFVTVAALIGTMTLWEAWARRSMPEADTSPFLSVKLVTAAALGFLVPIGVLGLFADVNLLSVWSWNLSNHALFYEHNVRTWWLWLLVNPLELALAAGLPIMCVVAASVVRLLRSGDWRTPRASAAVAFISVWGMLWLSGKNMGEAARLWILMLPWAVLMTADALQGSSQSEKRPSRFGSLIVWVLVAQLIAGLVTVMQVDGFHFAELLAG